MSNNEALATAEILPFPQPAQIVPEARQEDAALAAALAEGPRERLARALRTLEAAQAEQLLAVTKWRDAIGDLSRSVNGLGRSFAQYQDRLIDIAAKVQPRA
jgi:hypothetical protein